MRHHLLASGLASLCACALMAAPAQAQGNRGSEYGVTAWWVVFNFPDECSGDCGSNDLGDADVDACVTHATGSATSNGGNVDLVATLTEGGSSTFPFDSKPATPCLVNAAGAEIHPVVRSHDRAAMPKGTDPGGTVEAQILEAQTTSFGEKFGDIASIDANDVGPDEPCFLFPQEGDVDAALNARKTMGLRVCADIQFAKHEPLGDLLPSVNRPVFWNPVDALEAAGIEGNVAQLAGTEVRGAWSSLYRTDNAVTMFVRTSLRPRRGNRR